MIPENTDIVTWINKYFVDYAICTELVKDEDVRVIWYEDQSTNTGNPLVNRRNLVFDIYVKSEHEHDATDDLFRSRTRMVSQKIQEMLTMQYCVGQIAFMYQDDYDMGTKTVGYVRHRLVISYLAGHP